MRINRLELFFLIYVGLTKAYKYKGILEDDEIFNDCKDQPDNVLNLKGLFDFSKFTFGLEGEDISLEGNMTSIWDIQPNDRIQATFKLFKFDRGSWQPTLYEIIVPNFCDVMYDENQYWYKSWTKHIKNRVAIKDKCLSPGTVFIHNKFIVEFYIEVPSSNLDGLYKNVFTFKAFNQLNMPRRTSICFEARAQSVRQ